MQIRIEVIQLDVNIIIAQRDVGGRRKEIKRCASHSKYLRPQVKRPSVVFKSTMSPC